MAFRKTADFVHPEEIRDSALHYRKEGNIGVAFTYNEPLIGWEFVRDTAKLIHEAGMVNVMVTNGTAELSVLEELLPYIDAMNIDLKGFTDRYYREVEEMREMSAWIAGLPGRDGNGAGTEIPLHISRFFPRFHMMDRKATEVKQVYRLAEIAREKLRYVYTGNC